MERNMRCVRCNGRLFLDQDYDDRQYYYFCIACGHNEPYEKTDNKKPDLVDPVFSVISE